MNRLHSSVPAKPAVVMRYGAFGDMVMLLPMLRWLSERADVPVDVISSGGWTRPLLSMQPWVGELCLVDSRNAPYWFNRSQRDMVHWLGQRSDKTLFICQTDDKARAFARRAKLPDERVYWAKADGFLEGEHWIERWLRIAHAWYGQPFVAKNVAEYLRDGWLALDECHVSDCAQWVGEHGWSDRRLVLIQAGNKRTMRRGEVERSSNVKFWPDEHWAALCRHILSADANAQILFCGSPAEHEYATRLADGIAGPRAVSVADDLPIPRLLALQQRAHSMVSVDTGPAHSAAAMACPLVVLFGELDPRQWQPYAVDAAVHVVRAQTASAVRDITLEQVIQAWSALI